MFFKPGKSVVLYGNYRPMSLLPVISNVFELLLNNIQIVSIAPLLDGFFRKEYWITFGCYVVTKFSDTGHKSYTAQPSS